MKKKHIIASLVAGALLGALAGILSAVLWPITAHAQTVPAAMPTDPAQFAGVCANIPPTPPTLAGPARSQALNLTVRAGTAHARGNFAEAAGLYWQVFTLTHDVAQLTAITVELQGVGDNERLRLCALLACIIPRTSEGPQRGELTQRQIAARCSTQQVVVPITPIGPVNPPNTPIETFALTADQIAAVQADTDLLADLRRADGFNIRTAHEWLVPVRFRSRVATAVTNREASQRIMAPTTRRSALGYILPITGWAVGAGLLIAGAVTEARCIEANSNLDRANHGLTNGWLPIEAAAAANNCLAARILLSAGVALAGGGTAAYILWPRSRVTLTPSTGPGHAALVLRLSY